MPERADYDNAILLPRTRLRVPDPELVGGMVEKVAIRTAVGTMEKPWGIEGGFAVVYKFRTQQGRTLALRCFRAAMRPDIQQRYELIGPFFTSHLARVTAHFRYHEQGIMVKETIQGQVQAKVYPLIEMEWVDGETLLERVDALCRKQDRAGLENLVGQWQDLVRQLRAAGISHGDLCGTNVMVRTDGTLVLVDYDGVYLPEFAQLGLRQIVLGQADYQHRDVPERERPFNEYTDDFSALVIYTALLALSCKPELWTAYTQRTPQGNLKNTNLLFRSRDFAEAAHSSLFRDLERIQLASLQTALTRLQEACQLPVEDVRFPLVLLDPDYERRQHALQRFHIALASTSVSQIVAGYDAALLDTCQEISPDKRQLLELARAFETALHDEDEKALVNAAEAIEHFPYGAQMHFSRQERQRVELARRRLMALTRLRVALTQKRPQALVAAYDDVLAEDRRMTETERALVRLAKQYVRAVYLDSDQAINQALAEIERLAPDAFLFTAQERARIRQAERQQAMLERFQQALQSKQAGAIAASYVPQLDQNKNVTAEERKIARLAQRFVQALTQEKDQVLLQASEAILNFSQREAFLFTPAEQERIELATRRAQALVRLRVAFSTKRVQDVLAASDPLLETAPDLTEQERQLWQLVQAFAQARQTQDEQKLLDAWQELQRPEYQAAIVWTEEERQAILQARLHLVHARKKKHA